MRHLRPLIDLLLYGHFWIAAAALAMYAQTRLLLTGRGAETQLAGFVFFGTLALYGVHRLVGMRKVQSPEEEERYHIIHAFRRHIWIYTVTAGLAAGYFFLRLDRPLQLLLLAPCLISLGYVLPLPGGKRLRDYHLVKIFLISAAWSWITVVAPAREANLLTTLPAWLMAAGRFGFIFALAIPFDIRDLRIDAQLGVETLPSRFGPHRARRLAHVALTLMLVMATLNLYLRAFTWWHWVALALSAGLTAWLVHRSRRPQSDYFYTGLLDGMMIVQFLLVYLADGM